MFLMKSIFCYSIFFIFKDRTIAQLEEDVWHIGFPKLEFLKDVIFFMMHQLEQLKIAKKYVLLRLCKHTCHFDLNILFRCCFAMCCYRKLMPCRLKAKTSIQNYANELFNQRRKFKYEIVHFQQNIP